MKRARWAVIALMAVVSIAMLLVVAPGVSADASMGVVPAKLEMNVPRGDTRSSYITVFNKGDTPLDVTAYIMDYSIDKQNNFTFSEPGNETYSSAQWVTLTPTKFQIKPDSDFKVKVTIAVPSEVEPGGKYSIALFEATLPLQEGTTGVTSVLRVGTLILLTIPGVSDASIETSAEIGEVGLFRGSPMHAKMVVRNTGNIHLNVAGQVDFYDWQGSYLSSLPLGEITILPHTERELSALWGKEPSWGKIRAVFTLGYIDKTGELRNITAQSEQWFIPFKMIGIIGVPTLLALVALGWLIKRKISIQIKR